MPLSRIPAELATTPVSFRNRIINGDMRIDQRNAGATLTIARGNFGYPVDRWQVFNGGVNNGNVTAVRDGGDAPSGYGFVNDIKVVNVTAGAAAAADNLALYQPIEGFNIADLAWGTSAAKPITLSFWVKASVAGTYGVSIRNASANRSFVTGVAVTQANTWEYKTANIPGDTTGTWGVENGVGFYVAVALGAGSNFVGTANSWQAGNIFQVSGAVNLCTVANGSFQITGVQLEAGTVATPFERRDYGRELMMCQRYFQKFGGTLAFCAANMMSNNIARMWYSFPVVMRASPVGTNNFTGYGTGATQVQVFVNGALSNSSFACSIDFLSPYTASWVITTLSGTAATAGSFDFGSAAFISVNAEL